MTRSYRVIAGIMGMVLFMQGCTNTTQVASPLPQSATPLSQGTELGTSLQLTVPPSLDASPEVAAAALVDPNRVEEGVWYLLRGMGIGVYTGDGKQVLAGSETGPKDFWIYDFEVPLLARLAKEPSMPFSEFQVQLSDLGLKSGQVEVLRLYNDVYAANPSAYLARLFVSMKLQFEGDPEITPLQEWLLLLDTFIPPNPSTATGQAEPSRMSYAGAGVLALSRQGTLLGSGVAARLVQAGSCGSIQGGAFQANWGLVNSNVATAADLVAVGNAYYAIHGPLLARSVRAELRPSRSSVHEGHDAPGGSVTFNVVLDINYQVGGLLPFGSPTCGYLINLDPPLHSGEFPPARVWWRLGSAFKDHGAFKDIRGHDFDGSSPTETDPSGKTSVTFQARQEPANGQGQEKSVQATVRASFDPRDWIVAMGLTDARLLAFLPTSIDVSSPEPVSIEWHEQAAYEVDGVYWGAYHLKGTICGFDRPFTLQADQSLGGQPGVGEFVFTPTSASGGDWKYTGTMCGQGACLSVDASSTFELASMADEPPAIRMDPGSNWTVTAPIVGTLPLGAGRHLGSAIETVTLEPATAACPTQ